MLEVQNISISYGVCEVVKNISFALRRGEMLAIVGANGAGKTTLLKSLNGNLPTARGEILLDGQSLKSYSRREIAKKIAVIAQENETKFPVKVLDFILAGRFAHGGTFGWETPHDLRIARECLDICDLTNYENRLMNQLSGGERQRVILARALATEANILLLDEPTTNLDLAHQALLLRLVRERCTAVVQESAAVVPTAVSDASRFRVKDSGAVEDVSAGRTYDSSRDDCGTTAAAAIIITHDLNLASEFADEILLLQNGEILAHGAPEKVLTRENLMKVFAVEVLLDENPVSRKIRITTIY